MKRYSNKGPPKPYLSVSEPWPRCASRKAFQLASSIWLATASDSTTRFVCTLPAVRDFVNFRKIGDPNIVP